METKFEDPAVMNNDSHSNEDQDYLPKISVNDAFGPINENDNDNHFM
jgi:hypothetical protein